MGDHDLAHAQIPSIGGGEMLQAVILHRLCHRIEGILLDIIKSC